MAQTTIINKFGRIAGWNSKTCRVLGRDMEGITKLEYDDTLSKEAAYGAGKYPIGTEEGNYSARCSMSVYSEEIVGLQDSLTPGTRIQEIPPFDIVVSYVYGGRIVKDVIKNCEIRTVGKPVNQGDGKIIHDMEIHCSHIDWNV